MKPLPRSRRRQKCWSSRHRSRRSPNRNLSNLRRRPRGWSNRRRKRRRRRAASCPRHCVFASRNSVRRHQWRRCPHRLRRDRRRGSRRRARVQRFRLRRVLQRAQHPGNRNHRAGRGRELRRDRASACHRDRPARVRRRCRSAVRVHFRRSPYALNSRACRPDRVARIPTGRACRSVHRCGRKVRVPHPDSAGSRPSGNRNPRCLRRRRRSRARSRSPKG